jgi:alkylation response protein AidB-like acyl-CoA dehydrogenase
VDLTWSPEEQEFRAEVRNWLEANVPRPPLPSGDTREGFARHVEWERELFASRLSVVSWPEEYGGRGASAWQYYRAGAPQRVTQNGIFLLAPALFDFGTPEQKARLLPRMAAAEDLWCQGWSEPGAGSDLAAVTSRAERSAGGWVLHGQKTWTTRGAFCTHLFGLFRTDPSADRHRGLTYFLVPLDSSGVTVRGFPRLDGDEGFAEVFFDGVEVGEDAVLGEVDGGWSVAMATTGQERGLTLRSPGRFCAVADRLLGLFRAAGEPPRRRDAVVRGWMEAEAYRLLTLQEVSAMQDAGAGSAAVAARSSLSKLWWSEMDLRLHEAALGLLDEPELDGDWMRGYEFALAGPIYAGTNEIQRNIVAERLLGLPRQ